MSSLLPIFIVLFSFYLTFQMFVTGLNILSYIMKTKLWQIFLSSKYSICNFHLSSRVVFFSWIAFKEGFQSDYICSSNSYLSQSVLTGKKIVYLSTLLVIRQRDFDHPSHKCDSSGLTILLWNSAGSQIHKTVSSFYSYLDRASSLISNQSSET